MNDDELCQKVLAKYAEKYTSWSEIRVSEIVRNTFAGNLAVVNAKRNGRPTEGEICFVSPEGKVSIFDTTDELARFLESRFNQKWYEKLLSKGGVASLVTIVLLVALCVIAFYPDRVNQQVVGFLGAAFVAAIGFLFGTAGQSRS